MNPNNWVTVFSFCAIATLLSVGYGWLVKQEKLPFNSVMAYTDAQFQFIKVWINIALLFGIIIPIVIWIALWDTPIVRAFFHYYLFAVAVQLASERILNRTLCTSAVVISGTLYTGFRIWQLWSGLNLITYPQPWLLLFWSVLLFWVANMIMLITVAIPSIFPESNGYSLSSQKTD